MSARFVCHTKAFDPPDPPDKREARIWGPVDAYWARPVVLPWSLGTSTTRDTVDETVKPVAVERVQLGVRMEKKMVKVLKGLAEYRATTLGQLLEKIVLHSFEPVPGQEGEMCASPYSKDSLAVIADLKRIYGMDFDTHASRRFEEVDGAQ
jgi:hypothetical protein